MASTTWNPYGVAFTITATAGTVTRTSATRFTVVINASWKVYYSGNATLYGMSATSGGVTKTISSFGSSHSSGSASFTGTYSISGYSKQTKSISVTFKNYNSDTGESSSKTLTLSVSVPALTSYAIAYNANGGSGAPSSQTKYKGVTLTLSATKPTRTGYTFSKWNTASGGGGTSYSAGASYTANAAATLYAQWTANKYTISFNANGGTGAPSKVTKTYGQSVKLPTGIPTRTNYNFLGWAASSTATAATWSPGSTYNNAITANTTLYAVWELAYYPPVITDVSISRCDSTGNVDDLGTYFKADFSWECCQLLGENPVASIVVDYKLVTDTEYTSTTVTANGTTSGIQSDILGDGAISPDSRYDIRITVTDSSSYSPNHTAVKKTITTSTYAIDFLKGGRGVAFGKAATNANLIDSMWSFCAKTTGTDAEARMQAEAEAGSIYIYAHADPAGNRGIYGKNADGTSVNILTVDPNNDVAIAGKRLMHAQLLNDYWGMMTPTGRNDLYIRTTSPGLIPYQSGGHGNVGTASWPFNNGYFNNLYLDGEDISDYNRDTKWISLNSYIRYRKVGRITFVRGLSSGGKSLAAGSYTDVGTLPAGYRPYYDRYDFTFHCQGGQIWTQSAYVTSDGVIRLYHAESKAQTYWAFNVAYPSANA